MAGRPKNVKETKPRDTAARRQAEAAAASGITPLELLLTAMREEWRLVARARTAALKQMHRLAAAGIAERAAPYCHPRLANTTVNANVRRSITEYTDEELAVIASAASEWSADGVEAPTGRPH